MCQAYLDFQDFCFVLAFKIAPCVLGCDHPFDVFYRYVLAAVLKEARAVVGVMIIGRVWKRGTISKTFQFSPVYILLCNAFSPPVFSPRIHTYLQSTKPIIDLYERMGKVRKVDASKSVDEVSI